MCNQKRNIQSFGDKFNVAKSPVTTPRRYDARSLVTAKERQVETTTDEAGITTVTWKAEKEGYTEEYKLLVRLDEGSEPQSDGTGMMSGGYPVEIRFYTPVTAGR